MLPPSGAILFHSTDTRPSTVTYTNSSGSGSKVRVYPASADVHSSRSPSVHSPASSDSHSSFSSSDWQHLSEDDIGPSESASLPPRQHRSRRHNTEARPAPSRRQSSRYVSVEQEEPPRQHRSHRHRSSRHQVHEPHHSSREHREPRRQPSDDSSSGTVDLPDDYPGYGRHGPPAHAPFPPTGAYRHGTGPIPHSHGGYPPGMPAAPGAYPDPYQQQPQALVHRSQHDPFAYPSQSNPFAPGPPGQNPFSPMESQHSAGYFPPPETPQPPMPQHHRPGPPSHRPSMYQPGPPSSAGYGSELMVAPYGYPPMQGMQGMQGMPGMPHMMQPGYPMPTHSPYPGYPHMQASPPPPPAPAPPKEEPKEVIKEVVVEKDDSAMKAQIEALQAMLKQQEEDRLKREAAIKAEADAIKAEAAAQKLKEEQEAQKKEEIAAATAAAKAAAEKAAEDAAKAAKEESDKKLAEADAARAELEKKQKELEEVMKKNEPVPDMLKAPIKFKDAVGRKFSFPWHLCKTWKGMESLIKQAFLHVDVIGQHVQEGHYDLMGPDGEIILPQVWDTMIKPDWEVSMHMWPIPETPEKKKKEKEKPAEPAAPAEGVPVDPFANIDFANMMSLDPAAAAPKKAKKGDKKAKRTSVPIVEVPPAPPAGSPPAAGFVQVPPGFPAFDTFIPPGVDMVAPEAAPKKKKKPKELSGIAAWMAGGRLPAKKGDEKLELSGPSAAHHSLPSLHSLTALLCP
ncbi:hypothetical protein Q7P37_002942 [Cladosporium fusiforme]